MESDVKLYELLVDIKKQNNDYNIETTTNQAKILTKLNTTSNKTILVYILFGILVGITITNNVDEFIKYSRPAMDLVRTIMNIGD